MSGEYNLLVISLVFCALSLALVRGFPHGAPPVACVTMVPRHGVQPQLSSTPYKLTAHTPTFGHDDYNTARVYLELRGTVPFKGLMVQSRPQGSAHPIGRWAIYPDSLKTISCSGSNDTLTHIGPGIKWSMGFTWEHPRIGLPNFVFVATVVADNETFWLDVRSGYLFYSEIQYEFNNQRSETAILADSVVVIMMMVGGYVMMYGMFSVLLL